MSTETLTFTESETDYLRTQLLGRLATVDRSGAPQNNPVGFDVDEATGQLTIGGHGMAESRKFRNVIANSPVAFVVDDLASLDPWTPRFIEIRGVAEALVDVEPPMPGFGRAVIRITPTWIGSMGLEPGTLDGIAVRRSNRSSEDAQ